MFNLIKTKNQFYSSKNEIFHGKKKIKKRTYTNQASSNNFNFEKLTLGDSMI